MLQFRSDNPGLWFLHCHIVPDLLEGMSVMIDEVRSRQNPPPDNINRCGDFRISQSLFYEKLAFDPSNAAVIKVASYLCTVLLVVKLAVSNQNVFVFRNDFDGNCKLTKTMQK